MFYPARERIVQVNERRTVTHNTKLFTAIFVFEVIIYETFRDGFCRCTSTHKFTCKNLQNQFVNWREKSSEL